MKRTILQLKGEAREALKGNYSMAIVAYIIIMILVSMCSGLTMMLFGGETLFSFIMSQVFSLVVGLISSLFTVGMYKIFLDISRGIAPNLADIISMFKRHPDRVIVVSLIVTVIQYVFLLPSLVINYRIMTMHVSDARFIRQTLLMMLLLLIGTAVAALITLPFSLCYFLLVDYDELDAREAISKSVALMKGNYGRFIYMFFSFMGLYILSFLSCGVGLLWVAPYMTMTQIELYRDIQGELDATANTEELEEIEAIQEDLPGENPTDIHNYSGEA